MSTMERNAVPKRGPRFYREGERVLFECVFDRSTTIGPAAVTDAHREAYPREWQAFLDADVTEMIG